MPYTTPAPASLLLPKSFPATRPLSGNKPKPATGLRIGDYLIGDDPCTNLFGHPDIRY